VADVSVEASHSGSCVGARWPLSKQAGFNRAVVGGILSWVVH
jgi:hypothetical protein